MINAAVQFGLTFLNSARYKNTLNTPGVIYRFWRKENFLKLLDLNALKILCNEYISQIAPRYFELGAFGVGSRKKKNFLAFLLIRSFFVLAGNEDMHKISDGSKFRPDWTTDYGVSCP